MAANNNSIAPLFNRGLEDLGDAIGVTQFPSQFEWYQIVGGLQVQGGKVSVGTSATLTINFPAPYEKQLLGVWIQVRGAAGNNGYVNNESLNSFDVVNGVGARDYYWWAVGV